MKTATITSDDLNPEYMLQGIATELLVRIVRGEIDAVELAKKELANRCLDNNGKWKKPLK